MTEPRTAPVAQNICGFVYTAPDEAYFLGWREVPRVDPDGAEWIEVVPLTYEDVLFPQEGDKVVESLFHSQVLTDLGKALRDRVAGDPTVEVTRDVLINWGVPGVPKDMAPDILLVQGVNRPLPRRGTIHLKRYGARPVFALEVTSRWTRDQDFQKRKEFYALAGLPLYVLIDSEHGAGDDLRLCAFELRDGRLEPINLPDPNRIWLPVVDLWLCLEDGEVVLRDAQGEVWGDYLALRQAAAAAQAHAEAEWQRAEAERERADQLTAELAATRRELARLRGDPESPEDLHRRT